MNALLTTETRRRGAFFAVSRSQLHHHGQCRTEIERLLSLATIDLNLQKMLVAGCGGQNAILQGDPGRIGKQLHRRDETNAGNISGAIRMRHEVLRAVLPVDERKMHPHRFFETSFSNVVA